MKKLVSLLLCLVLALSLSSALAAGKLNVVQENFHAVTGYTTYGYCYAKVENSGDKAIKVHAGVLEMYDEAGDVITSEDYVEAHARYLQPGEYTYVKLYEDTEDVVPADYMLTLTGKSENDAMSLRFPCVPALEMGVSDGWWDYNYMYATVTNDTEEPLYDLSVVMALLDEAGNILYMESDSLYSNRALTPGSSMIFRTDIPSDFMEYFEANGLTPASVDAIAYVEVDLED